MGRDADYRDAIIDAKRDKIKLQIIFSNGGVKCLNFYYG